MKNPLLERQAKGNHGTLSERRLAKRLGARLHPGSGSRRKAKSDMSTTRFRFEAKSTIVGRLSIELAWLVKIAQEARANGQLPALTLSFVGPDGRPRLNGEWVAVPYWVFYDLIVVDHGD